jgi:16S rRNA (cytosine1402-N4)-methyltransferase
MYLDCTLGEGGHTEEILRASAPDGRVIGLDRDLQSIDQARERLAAFGRRVVFHHESFVHLDAVLDREVVQEVDGILFDLGVSSVQLEVGDRGFSFLKDGPLDMRMDQTKGKTASELIHQLSESDLTRIFQEYGEERWAKRISRFIVQERARAKITRTSHLAELILKAIPKRYHVSRIHPATRVFQALRIAVNDELSNLRLVMEAAIRRLKSTGRLCIISFHSLEDRIVKHGFRDWEKQGRIAVITKRPVVAREEERMLNPRCRSAKLRAAERI